jgi:hypothetical protein
MELLLVGLAQRPENEFTPTGHPPYPVASYVLRLIQARLCSKASWWITLLILAIHLLKTSWMSAQFDPHCPCTSAVSNNKQEKWRTKAKAAFRRQILIFRWSNGSGKEGGYPPPPEKKATRPWRRRLGRRRQGLMLPATAAPGRILPATSRAGAGLGSSRKGIWPKEKLYGPPICIDLDMYLVQDVRSTYTSTY